MAEINLTTKLVGEISGDFFVPSYQRGYRWGRDEVTRLLEDVFLLWTGEDRDSKTVKNYCLQPVVVKNSGGVYELIDGQQRLTTLYLIYKFMSSKSNGWIKEAKFTLSYKTREKSEKFLKDIDMSMREDNIDFWFICSAYEVISEWFEEKERQGFDMPVVAGKMNELFANNVRVIWYEVGESEDAIALFARLNIGKIPLTSAELVKAMFLSRDNDNDMTRQKQEEIALQWDNMERELHNDSFWYFLTNASTVTYETRIDLLLDLIAEKPEGCRDKYYAFFQFDAKRKTKNLNEIWCKIRNTFLILKEWYEEHELYHKIGYLIASGYCSLSQLYMLSKNKSKKEYKNVLDNLIKGSIKIDKNYAELRYDSAQDANKISRLLLLFNVESVRKNDEETQRFPFDKFKYDKRGKVLWSLEHIHAQNSEGLKKESDWRKWIELHYSSIQSLDGENEELLEKMKTILAETKIVRSEYENIQRLVMEKLSKDGSVEYMHTISNLALLNCGDNAALNNSAFDVKRNLIIDMDKRGKYIPFCTKMVFFKYYTDSAENQLHFWGIADRKAYVEHINQVLGEYLDEYILFGKGESK